MSALYHLHLDAAVFPDELDTELRKDFGFMLNDFVGHPEGYRHFEPQNHRTLKFPDLRSFEEVWQAVEPRLRSGGFVGYMEAEFIRSTIGLDEKPFDERVPVPFHVTRRRLAGAPSEPFRQAEFHLTLDRDRSDPRLIKTLLDAGLYGAYIPKPGYTALVLTLQGFLRDIKPLTQRLQEYLESAGGVVTGKLMEEIAIRYALIGDTGPEQLPEIVDTVAYTT